MNYLAHILLSGPDRRVQVGNFIGDAVKGGAYRHYPKRVAEGIVLHRAIDAFTDSHPAVREAVRMLKPHFGRYSGILLDVFFDYLLSSRFDEFSRVPLRRFTRRFYLALIVERRHLPPRIKRFMWHFILTDRLCRYATPEGLRESLAIMVRVRRMDVSATDAVDYLVRHEDELRTLFRPFFADLQAFCDARRA